ncbi:MAG: NAD/NADP octopine/nopaline dehydrogenase family protein [Nanoarchaeota archaeon]
MTERYAILGLGNGGHAFASHLTLAGKNVSVYDRNPEKIAAVRELGGIYVEGEIEGFAPIERLSCDLDETISDADIIMVVTTADAHYDMAKKMSPYLRDDQIVVLNPGRTGGVFEFEKALGKTKPIIAETSSLIYVCRSHEPGNVRISKVKNNIILASRRREDSYIVSDALSDVYPQIKVGGIFECSFSNIGAVFHPTVLLSNRDRLEEGFDFYREGVTRDVEMRIEAVDRERVDVAKALGVDVLPIKDWLTFSYGIRNGVPLRIMIDRNPAYKNLPAPRTLNVRYITEDVPTGLVPISEFGKLLDVKTPTIDVLIAEASEVMKIDFRKTGRTLEKMGFNNNGLEYMLSEDIPLVA